MIELFCKLNCLKGNLVAVGYWRLTVGVQVEISVVEVQVTRFTGGCSGGHRRKTSVVLL